MVPNMTICPESSLVNFVTLAESVVLEPVADFWTSVAEFSMFEVKDLNLLTVVLLSELFGFQTPPYMKGKFFG